MHKQVDVIKILCYKTKNKLVGALSGGPQGKKWACVLEMTGPISRPSLHLYSSERKENPLLLEGRFHSCYPSIPLSEEV